MEFIKNSDPPPSSSLLGPLPLTLVVITFNEEKNLGACLDSTEGLFQERIVVDSGSTDRTQEIAEARGVRFFSMPWRGFGPQKKWATAQASWDWIFSLDADERLSETLRVEVLQRWKEISQNPEVSWRTPRRSWHLGRWIDHGGWYPDWQVRLFHRDHFQWNENLIHERVVSLDSPKSDPQEEYRDLGKDTSKSSILNTLKVNKKKNGQLKSFYYPLHHFVFQDLRDQVDTNNRYSSLQAQEAFERGQKWTWWGFLVKPWVKFLECYLIKRGFLDGGPGFIIAVGAAYSVFLRWAKLGELHREKKEPGGAGKTEVKGKSLEQGVLGKRNHGEVKTDSERLH